MVNGFSWPMLVCLPSRDAIGMLSFARSLAVVFSANRCSISRADAPIVKAIGQAKMAFARAGRGTAWFPELSSHFWSWSGWPSSLGMCFNSKAWAAISLRLAATNRLPGSPVFRSIGSNFQAYVFSSFTASLASLLLLGYNGSAINAMGQGYELRVIAATVIGGANLMGGAGTAFGAFIGSAFLEVIRNALLMAASIPIGRAHLSALSSFSRCFSDANWASRSCGALEQLFPKKHRLETEFTAGISEGQ